MRAYVKVIYSSEGSSPSEVDEVFERLDFQRIDGTSVFRIEVEDEKAMRKKLGDLHDSIRGMEIEYIPSRHAPSEALSEGAGGSREKLEGLRPFGLDVDELGEILDRDPEEFKERALDMLRIHMGRIASEREKEMQEERARRRLKEARERLIEEMRAPEGRTFHELAAAVDIESSLLSKMLDDMVEKGAIRPEQRGRKVVFRAE